VLTQPDRPAGRGLRASQSAVKLLALNRGLDIYQPEALSRDDARERIAAARADFIVVAAYGLILPQPVLDAARWGALNIHASLLPRWRGAAPIQRALLAGDATTGITIMRMDAGLDTGPLLAQERIDIASDDDAGSLHDKLAALGARMIVEVLADAVAGPLQAVPQPSVGVTYARKLDKREMRIDWLLPAAAIGRQVRALCPAPGASTRLRDERLKIWRADVRDARGAPGEVLAMDAQGVLVACGQGALQLKELQRAGGRRLTAMEFLRGFAIAAGERMG
jgi:methionyl-tRNA formyltransferase